MKVKFFSQKFRRRFLLVLGLVFVCGELGLRFFVGFCNAPLYRISAKYEYIPMPNQAGNRFGNIFFYNTFSQRSKAPDSTKKIILGLGDSVIHGGVLTDQDSLATSIFSAAHPNYQMLNISAGSWGPDNCAAYLKEHGTFGAEALFLVVSSHDAFDNMTFTPVVGEHPSYPAKQYGLAWAELIDRYVMPELNGFWNKQTKPDPDQAVENGIGIQKQGKTFNTGFDDLKELADSLNVPFTLYLHADQAELKQKKYNAQGDLITQWAGDNGVTLIEELDFNFTPTDYRDGIHLSESGQRKLGEVMEMIFFDLL